MQSNEDRGAARPADDPALEAHVTAIMDAVAIADDPAALRDTVRRQLIALKGEGLGDRIRGLLLSNSVDHATGEDGPQPSDALLAIRKTVDLIRCAQELDDVSFSGVILASVLQSRPWLLAFEVEVRTQGNLGDEGGGYYVGYDIDVDNLLTPAICVEPVGRESIAEIASELEDDAPALAGAVGLADVGDETFRFTVDRRALNDLLDAAAATATPISGLAVARRIWPQRMAVMDARLRL